MNLEVTPKGLGYLALDYISKTVQTEPHFPTPRLYHFQSSANIMIEIDSTTHIVDSTPQICIPSTSEDGSRIFRDEQASKQASEAPSISQSVVGIYPVMG